MSAEILRIAAASLLTAIICFYIFVFRKEIIILIEEGLIQNFRSLFASKANRVFYGIFYKFNHKSIDDWIEWVKSRNADIQEKAFDRLVHQLSKESKDLGNIVKNISQALISLDHDASYAVFEDLLECARKEWNDSQSSLACYEEASLALMKVNETKAQELLIKEFNEIGEEENAEEFKRSLIAALALMENEKKAELIKSLIKEGIDQHNEILALCFASFCNDNETIWKDISDYCSLKLEDKDKEKLNEVLIQSQDLSEQEQNLVKLEQEYQNLAKELELNPEEKFIELATDKELNLYEHLEELYKNFETIVDKDEQAIKVMTGSAAKDKVYMAQQYAIKKETKTICINLDLVMQDSDSVSEIEKLITEEHKLIYCYNCSEFMTENIEDGAGKELLELIAKLNTSDNHKLIIAIDNDMEVIKLGDSQLAQKLEQGEEFMQVCELTTYDQSKKEEIFAEYKAYLKPERELEPKAKDLSKNSQSKGYIEFMCQLLEEMIRPLAGLKL